MPSIVRSLRSFTDLTFMLSARAKMTPPYLQGEEAGGEGRHNFCDRVVLQEEKLKIKFKCCCFLQDIAMNFEPIELITYLAQFLGENFEESKLELCQTHFESMTSNSARHKQNLPRRSQPWKRR